MMSRQSCDFCSCILLIIFIPLISFQSISASTSDTINTTQSIRDGQTLVSSGSGRFELGFFSPGNSRNRYVGMWYRHITVLTYVWVANRDSPLTDTSGVLRVIHPGILVLVNGTNGTIVWSSNTSTPLHNPVAQLLNSGNLVVRDTNNDRPENFVWQSFDYPTDTYLPGMNLGWNLVTQKETYLSSWRSNDDPGTGDFSFRLDPTGYPQILVKRGQAVQSRIGPWNGILFPGPPNAREENTYRLTFEMDAEKVYYKSDLIDESYISKYVMNQSGISQRWNWVDRTQGWIIYFNMPADLCDTYRLCGVYGRCDAGSSPPCQCLDKFVPRDPDGWIRADPSSGCLRRTNLSCKGDGFIRYSGIKLPDARTSWHNASMTLQECREECLRNCSCMAYTQLDIRRRSGCLIWYDDLVDIRTLSRDGQDIYIRMASSESGEYNSRSHENDSELPFFELAAWILHREGRSLELVDASIDEEFYSWEVLRSIQVGLLCVQQKPEDRPNMSSVVLMLGNNGEILEAKQPGFFTQRDVLVGQSSSSTKPASSANEVTITMPEPR
ncbi:hypothetical protein BUALT_Bualt09G0007400 [Buddleja alternifolia]|uniref:Uncharacterized protein n=1 Tax=Buddleja alternifolia TaxID=168488 RepID=A0AAV6X7H0_9LAMI|nr:hypothetical protein BUALT_Bualt09G0007400 [Buddleja alternifolia]